MHGTLSDQQRFLRESVATLAEDIGVRADTDVASIDPGRVWRTLVDAGFTDVAGRHGPAAGSVLDLAVVVEAFGRRLCPAPLLGSAVLATTLAGTVEGGGELLEEMSSGERIAAVGLVPGLGELADVGCHDEVVAWDGGPAATVLALDRRRGAVVRSDDVGTVLDGVDPLRPLRRSVGADWRVLGPIGQEAMARWTAVARTMLAAEMLGLMDGALAMAVDYAKARRQFGHPIGSFQALQHLCADALVAVESTRSAVYAAADLLDGADGRADGLGRGADAAAVAKVYASRHVRPVIEASLQVHGGVGMTWEFPGHLYLRRGLLDRATLGDESSLVVDLGATLLASGEEPARV